MNNDNFSFDYGFIEYLKKESGFDPDSLIYSFESIFIYIL
jgi:hypothetical protein